MYPRPYPIVPFYEWGAWQPSAPVIPKLYWDDKSQEQRIHRLCKQLHKLCDYANELGVAIDLDHKIIEALEDDFEKFMESGFLDYYETKLDEWVRENLPVIIAKAVQLCFFGLTEDGYFCAYIPQSWAGVRFDTIMDYSSSDYGHLTIDY